MSSARLANLFTGLLTICAVLVTAAVVKREFFPTEKRRGDSASPGPQA
jgi:hypothetical protein